MSFMFVFIRIRFLLGFARFQLNLKRLITWTLLREVKVDRVCWKCVFFEQIRPNQSGLVEYLWWLR